MNTFNKIMLSLKEKGKTQKQLTDYLSVSQGIFSQWKKGTNTSYLKYISQIAEYLEVSTDYLLRNELKKIPLSQLSDKDIEVQKIADRIMALPPESQSVILAALDQFEKFQGPK